MSEPWQLHPTLVTAIKHIQFHELFKIQKEIETRLRKLHFINYKSQKKCYTGILKVTSQGAPFIITKISLQHT